MVKQNARQISGYCLPRNDHHAQPFPLHLGKRGIAWYVGRRGTVNYGNAIIMNTSSATTRHYKPLRITSSTILPYGKTTNFTNHPNRFNLFFICNSDFSVNLHKFSNHEKNNIHHHPISHVVFRLFTRLVPFQ